MKRVDAVIVQAVVTQYAEDGTPVEEQLTQPAKVFLVKWEPFIAQVKAEVEKLNGKS